VVYEVVRPDDLIAHHLTHCALCPSVSQSVSRPVSDLLSLKPVIIMDRFLSSATPDERDALMEAMNELQVEEMQQMFNSLAQKCFNRCVNNFRARQLDSGERNCIGVCADKYMQHMARVGARFAEETMPAQQPQTQQQTETTSQQQ